MHRGFPVRRHFCFELARLPKMTSACFRERVLAARLSQAGVSEQKAPDLDIGVSMCMAQYTGLRFLFLGIPTIYEGSTSALLMGCECLSHQPNSTHLHKGFFKVGFLQGG